MPRESIRRRAAFLTLVFVIPAFLILAGRLLWLQVIAADDLLVRATPRGSAYSAQPRGLITDSEGTALALSLRVWSLAANPGRIQEPEKLRAARVLASLLGAAEETLLTELRRDSGFAWLARRLDPAVEESVRAAIRDQHLEQVTLVPEYVRSYPFGRSAAHVLGFTGYEGNGLEGIEKQCDAELRGGPGAEGRTVVLHLHRMIQHIAEEELAAHILKYQAASGTAVVLDVRTGAVLAMASYPTFDPNDYAASDSPAWRNRALTDVFEPGSIFKIFIASALLDKGAVRLTDTHECHSSILRYGHTYNCHAACGLLDFPGVIAHSCNVGMIESVEKIATDDLYRVLRDFGFGVPTGIELPGEVSGTLRKPATWSGLTRYSLSIGYEMTTTPLQMVTAAAAIANQGVLLRPQLVREVRDRTGRAVRASQPTPVRRVIGAATAQTMLRLMRGVVENGTGTKAAIVGFSVAGKTGTARLPNLETGGYYEDRYISSFIGVAPADDPRLAILVSINRPQGEYYAAQVAAPVFARIAKRTLDQWGITPLGSLDLGGDTGTARNAAFDNQPGVMPDLRGLTLRDARALLGADSLRARFEGSGRVVAQEPAPGASTWSGEIAVRLQ